MTVDPLKRFPLKKLTFSKESKKKTNEKTNFSKEMGSSIIGFVVYFIGYTRIPVMP